MPVASADTQFGECSPDGIWAACAYESSEPDAPGECSSTSGQWANETSIVVGVERAHAQVYGADYCQSYSNSNWSRRVSALAIFARYDAIVLDERITVFRWSEESSTTNSGTRNSTSFTILDRTWQRQENELGEWCIMIYPELGNCPIGPPPPAPHRPWGRMLWCDEDSSDAPVLEAASCIVAGETERLPADAITLAEWATRVEGNLCAPVGVDSYVPECISPGRLVPPHRE